MISANLKTMIKARTGHKKVQINPPLLKKKVLKLENGKGQCKKGAKGVKIETPELQDCGKSERVKGV